MVVRITSWNVNGIRNPFSYQPWRESRTFAAMFDILEADIVVMQETKIQRKDLRDDMVLVPGWDVYFSLPKHKKGYSGVAIYTRNSVCAPIRVEEGITGVLCPPNSSTSFSDLPEDQQIGGYPGPGQLSLVVDEATLDSEGRCVILEFPAFVLIGTYSPATRDESRDDFRWGYLEALDARIRNLVAMGKRVVLTGDLNVIRADIDTANIAERLKKDSLTMEDFFSAPARRLFNHWVFGGLVYGSRDEGRENPVLWDLGRVFNPSRPGMFTCWETKKNARPGNFGSRIDYVLCSDQMKEWFVDSNIQEGLMGSDHCPVFATLSDVVHIDGEDIHLRDLMNPPGMFKNGIRLRDWETKDQLPMSAKLIPEFHRRQSIRDMFFRKPGAISKAEPAGDFEESVAVDSPLSASSQNNGAAAEPPAAKPSPSKMTALAGVKRVVSGSSPTRPQKKPRPNLAKESSFSKGQRSLKGFFKPTSTEGSGKQPPPTNQDTGRADPGTSENMTMAAGRQQRSNGPVLESTFSTSPVSPTKVFDPIESKESWSKLLGKRTVPRCDHGEDCISLVTKKPGVNCGKCPTQLRQA